MMSLTPISTLLLSILFIFLHQSAVATSSLSANSDQLSAYDILQSYNFPVGLLPKGITKYDIDRETGQFHAYLDGTCSFSLEGSYQLKYKSKISGYISENKLTSLTGVSVKVLFFWLNIVEVTRNGDDIDFSVGIASASFPIDNFYECPQCGCGLDCVSGQARHVKQAPRKWYKKIDSVTVNQGFSITISDHCVFVKKVSVECIYFFCTDPDS